MPETVRPLPAAISESLLHRAMQIRHYQLVRKSSSPDILPRLRLLGTLTIVVAVPAPPCTAQHSTAHTTLYRLRAQMRSNTGN